MRQRLADAGFAWQRRPGHGAKKHCLTARYTGVPAPPEIYPLPWYSRVPAAPNTQRIAIIGAGIAGATVADALARRGHAACYVATRLQPASGWSSLTMGWGGWIDENQTL